MSDIQDIFGIDKSIKNTTFQSRCHPVGNNLFRAKKAGDHTLSVYHKHDYLQLWYVTNGSFRHIINDHEYIHSAGEFLVLPPYIPHQLDTRNSEDLEWIFIEITDDFLNIFPEGAEKDTLFDLICLRPLMHGAVNYSDPFLHFTPKASEKIMFLLESLLDEYENSSNLSPIYVRADLVRLLALIVDEYNRAIPQRDKALYARYRIMLQDTLDYINQNYTKPIKLGDVCNVALMAKSSFSYIFPQFTGRTFVDYLHHLRIRLAKKLLTESDMSITDICMECGFVDVTHFGRVFKKIVGCSPREYIKSEKSDS